MCSDLPILPKGGSVLRDFLKLLERNSRLFLYKPLLHTEKHVAILLRSVRRQTTASQTH